MTFHYQSPDSYSYHTNDPALVALIMGCYFLIIFLSLAAAALVYVSRWHIFKKMGMPGWKGIIPYYGDYMLFKTVWTTKAFWAMIIGAGVYLVLYLVSFEYFYHTCHCSAGSPQCEQFHGVPAYGCLGNRSGCSDAGVSGVCVCDPGQAPPPSCEGFRQGRGLRRRHGFPLGDFLSDSRVRQGAVYRTQAAAE